MYIPDLAPYHDLRGIAPQILCAGWLDAEHPFPTGPVPADRLDTLIWLLHHERAEQYRGVHDCRLCTERDEEGIVRARGSRRRAALGRSNLYVPERGADGGFLVPDMIIHYVEAHGYQPPEPLLEALHLVDRARLHPARLALQRALRKAGMVSDAELRIAELTTANHARDNYRMACSIPAALTIVDAEPFPVRVAATVVDRDGIAHRIVDKEPIFRDDLDPPGQGQVFGVVEGTWKDRGVRYALVSIATPWGLCTDRGETELELAWDALGWPPLRVYGDGRAERL